MRHTHRLSIRTMLGSAVYVGDVRNLDSVRDVMYGANYVFMQLL